MADRGRDREREREGRSRADREREREREREVCKLKAGLGRQGVIGTREIEIVCKGFKKIILKNIKKL